MLGLCCWAAVCPVVESGGCSSCGAGFFLHCLLVLQSTGLWGFRNCGSWALEHNRLSSCGPWAWLLHGMWDLPGSRDPAYVSCVGRWILYHWATKEASSQIFKWNFPNFQNSWKNSVSIHLPTRWFQQLLAFCLYCFIYVCPSVCFLLSHLKVADTALHP